MFREDKTTQMAARFLRMAEGRIPYIKLLKLLYLSDKRMLVERGKPITYDKWYAMKHGPVLSATYNLIKGEIPSTYWADYIATDGFDVVLIGDPGSDELSPAEDCIIDAVYEEYKSHNKWDLIRKLHDELREWQDPGDSSREMKYETVLRAEGLSDDDIEGILRNIALQNDVELSLRSS